MRPTSLRRFGIAAVAGGLLLASGTVPGFASDGDKTEGTQPTRVTGSADGTPGSWIRVFLTEGARALERGVDHILSWSNKVFVPAVAPVPVPVKTPLGVIVDDGAPF